MNNKGDFLITFMLLMYVYVLSITLAVPFYRR